MRSAPRPVAGAQEHRVARRWLHAAFCGGVVQIVRRHRDAGFQLIYAPRARDVEQDAAGDDPLPGDGDRKAIGPGHRTDLGGGDAVVHVLVPY